MGRDIASLPEHDNHRAVVVLEDKRQGLRAIVAIHRGGVRYPSFGATRMVRYPSFTDAVRDALRLSRGMSFKSAMAGLPFGGAKAVIDLSADGKVSREQLLRAYAERLPFLEGRFVTGTDVGLCPDDIRAMREYTTNLVGLAVDPSRWTATGIIHAMEAAAKARWGSADLAGRSVAIQGLGKVGGALARMLDDREVHLVVSDLKSARMKRVMKQYPGTTGVSPSHILQTKVDILAPCAMFHVLNEGSVPALHCEMVIGGANNQLESPAVGDALHRRGILYVPDYVTNAGGLISVTQEYVESGRPTIASLERAVARVGTTATKVIAKSLKTGQPTHRVADRLAKERVRRFT